MPISPLAYNEDYFGNRFRLFVCLKSTSLRYDLGRVFSKLLPSFLGSRYQSESTLKTGTAFFLPFLKTPTASNIQNKRSSDVSISEMYFNPKDVKKKLSLGKYQMLKDKTDVVL